MLPVPPSFYVSIHKCRYALRHDLHGAHALEQLLQLAIASLAGGVIATADELATNEHTRHGPATGNFQKRVLDVIAVVPVLQLQREQTPANRW